MTAAFTHSSATAIKGSRALRGSCPCPHDCQHTLPFIQFCIHTLGSVSGTQEVPLKYLGLICFALWLPVSPSSHVPSPLPVIIPILKLRKLRHEIKTCWHEVQEIMGKELAFKTITQTQIQQLTTASHISLVLADGTSGYSSKHRRRLVELEDCCFCPGGEAAEFN